MFCSGSQQFCETYTAGVAIADNSPSFLTLDSHLLSHTSWPSCAKCVYICQKVPGVLKNDEDADRVTLRRAIGRT